LILFLIEQPSSWLQVCGQINYQKNSNLKKRNWKHKKPLGNKFWWNFIEMGKNTSIKAKGGKAKRAFKRQQLSHWEAEKIKKLNADIVAHVLKQKNSEIVSVDEDGVESKLQKPRCTNQHPDLTTITRTTYGFTKDGNR
jgi:hypothetical protein